MKQADFIISLDDDGQVLKQGSYEDVQRSTLDDFESRDERLRDMTQLFIRSPASEEDKEHQESVLGPVESPGENSSHEKTADASIYKYYFSALGWQRILILLIFLTINSGTYGLICKLYLIVPVHFDYDAYYFFSQMYGSSFGLRAARMAPPQTLATGSDYMLVTL